MLDGEKIACDTNHINLGKYVCKVHHNIIDIFYCIMGSQLTVALL